MEQLKNPYPATQILVCEFVVLEEIDFDLVVYHPFEMLNAMVRESNLADKCPDTLWSIVNDSYQTPIALLYAPHIVALGCLHVVAHIKELDLSDWFASLDVDHAAVWDVARRVLELYDLLQTLHRLPLHEKPKTERLLERLPQRTYPLHPAHDNGAN